MFFERKTATQESFLLQVTAALFPKGCKPCCINDFLDGFEINFDFTDPHDFVVDEALGFSEDVIGFKLAVITESQNNFVQTDVDNIGILDIFEPYKEQLIRKAKEELARMGSSEKCCEITFLGLFSAKITPLADDYSVKYKLCQLLSIKDACSILSKAGA